MRINADCCTRRGKRNRSLVPPYVALLDPWSDPLLPMLRSSTRALRACRLPFSPLARLPLQPPLRCPAPVSAGRFFASTPSSEEKPTEPEKKPSRWQRIKSMFREHGPVFVGFYVTTWTAGAAVCYGGITIAGVDGIALLKYLTVDEMLLTHTSIDISGWSPALINGLIALELNEMLEYVRLPVVIAMTPALSRYIAPYRRGAALNTQAAAAVAEAEAAAEATVAEATAAETAAAAAAKPGVGKRPSAGKRRRGG